MFITVHKTMTDPYMKARQGYDPQFTVDQMKISVRKIRIILRRKLLSFQPGGWVTYQGQDSQRILKSSPRRILNQVK